MQIYKVGTGYSQSCTVRVPGVYGTKKEFGIPVWGPPEHNGLAWDPMEEEMLSLQPTGPQPQWAKQAHSWWLVMVTHPLKLKRKRSKASAIYQEEESSNTHTPYLFSNLNDVYVESYIYALLHIFEKLHVYET